MKKLISLFLFIFIALSVYAQNDYLMLTRTRPLMEVFINGKKCAMLIDTGSAINILCTSKLSRYGVDKNLSKNYTKTISGVREVYTINKIDVAVKGRAVSLFYSVDIDAVCKSMEAETGIEVVGILGTPAIRQLGMIINLPGGIVTIKADTVK